MWLVLFFLTHASAADLLLFSTIPVKEHPDVNVETYFRERKNWYFFTVSFEIRNKLFIRRFRTKISFSTTEAKEVHDEFVGWTKKQLALSEIYRSQIAEERKFICPFDPFEPEEEETKESEEPTAEEEQYIIRTN